MGGVDRAAAGDRPDELEVGEGEQHREGHHHRDDRREQRIGDVAEHLPAGRPIDGRGLVERGRHRLEAGQQRDGHERNAAPDIHEDDRPARVPGAAEKVDIGRDQVKLAQRPRDDRELRVEQPPEGDRGEHRRHDEGDEHDRADHRLEGEILVEQQRQIEPEPEFDGAGHAGVEQRVEDREPEHRVARDARDLAGEKEFARPGEPVLEGSDHPFVVLQPDEGARAPDARIGEGQPDAQAQRIGEKQDQEGRRRQHEPQAEPVAVDLEPLPRGAFPRGRPGDARLNGDVGHTAHYCPVTSSFEARLRRAPQDDVTSASQ